MKRNREKMFQKKKQKTKKIKVEAKRMNVLIIIDGEILCIQLVIQCFAFTIHIHIQFDELNEKAKERQMFLFFHHFY